MQPLQFSALLPLAVLALQASATPIDLLTARDNGVSDKEFWLALCPGAPKHLPGDTTTCVFNANTDPITKVYGYTYSQTGSNCNGGTQPFKTSIGISETIEDTWSTSESVGAGVDGGDEVPIGISVSIETSQDHGKSVTHDQTIEYEVPLNKQSAMVSQQGYNRQNGKLTITVKDPIDGKTTFDVVPFYQDVPDPSDANTSPRDFECNESMWDVINGYNMDPSKKQW